jgi:hypothetical protein
MQLSVAFLICHSFLSQYMDMGNLHTEIHKALGQAEYGEITFAELVMTLSNVDSQRGIPLAECILEQYSTDRQYPNTEYPKPNSVIDDYGNEFFMHYDTKEFLQNQR